MSAQTFMMRGTKAGPIMPLYVGAFNYPPPPGPKAPKQPKQPFGKKRK